MKTKDKALVIVLALSIVSAALLSEDVGSAFVFFVGTGFTVWIAGFFGLRRPAQKVALFLAMAAITEFRTLRICRTDHTVFLLVAAGAILFMSPGLVNGIIIRALGITDTGRQAS